MTLHEALDALLNEYGLESAEDLVRDEAKQDPEYDGLSCNHPKVVRFREVCRVLRAHVEAERHYSRVGVETQR